MPAYVATWKPLDWLEVTYGALDGRPVYRLGGFLSW